MLAPAKTSRGLATRARVEARIYTLAGADDRTRVLPGCPNVAAIELQSIPSRSKATPSVMTPPDPESRLSGPSVCGPTVASLRRRPGAAPATAWLLRLAATVPAAAFLLGALTPPLNHDVAAVLNFAERMLAGERLYADLIDVNPPLVFVLNLLPAAIGAWTPLDAVQGLLISLLGLCAVSAWLA